jgi:hypothetical protein
MPCKNLLKLGAWRCGAGCVGCPSPQRRCSIGKVVREDEAGGFQWLRLPASSFGGPFPRPTVSSRAVTVHVLGTTYRLTTRRGFPGSRRIPAPAEERRSIRWHERTRHHGNAPSRIYHTRRNDMRSSRWVVVASIHPNLASHPRIGTSSEPSLRTSRFASSLFGFGW